jgi:large subunit ribosomal protein L11
VGEVVSEINEKTKDFEGMEVPVDVEVDEETGDFTVEVGKPPVAALIKDVVGFDTGSGEPNREKVADMSFSQACRIARMKSTDLLGMDLQGCVKEVIGSAQSMGVTIDGKDAYEVQQEIDAGEYDEELEEEDDIQ